MKHISILFIAVSLLFFTQSCGDKIETDPVERRVQLVERSTDIREDPSQSDAIRVGMWRELLNERLLNLAIIDSIEQGLRGPAPGMPHELATRKEQAKKLNGEIWRLQHSFKDTMMWPMDLLYAETSEDAVHEDSLKTVVEDQQLAIADSLPGDSTAVGDSSLVALASDSLSADSLVSDSTLVQSGDPSNVTVAEVDATEVEEEPIPEEEVAEEGIKVVADDSAINKVFLWVAIILSCLVAGAFLMLILATLIPKALAWLRKRQAKIEREEAEEAKTNPDVKQIQGKKSSWRKRFMFGWRESTQAFKNSKFWQWVVKNKWTLVGLLIGLITLGIVWYLRPENLWRLLYDNILSDKEVLRWVIGIGIVSVLLGAGIYLWKKREAVAREWKLWKESRHANWRSFGQKFGKYFYPALIVLLLVGGIFATYMFLTGPRAPMMTDTEQDDGAVPADLDEKRKELEEQQDQGPIVTQAEDDEIQEDDDPKSSNSQSKKKRVKAKKKKRTSPSNSGGASKDDSLASSRKAGPSRKGSSTSRERTGPKQDKHFLNGAAVK